MIETGQQGVPKNQKEVPNSKFLDTKLKDDRIGFLISSTSPFSFLGKGFRCEVNDQKRK
jgi:hypothetical protein